MADRWLPKTAQEASDAFHTMLPKYMEANPGATYQDALDSFAHYIREGYDVSGPTKLGVAQKGVESVPKAPPQPDTTRGKMAAFPENVGEAATRATGSPLAGAATSFGTSLLVPTSPEEAGAMAGSGAVGGIMRKAPAMYRTAGRILGAVGGATATGPTDQSLGENFQAALPFAGGQAVGEAALGGRNLLRNVKETFTPYKQGEKLTEKFFAGLAQDFDMPNLKKMLMGTPSEKPGQVAAMGPARIREVFGEVMQQAEDKIRAALPNAGTTQLSMPSLAQMTQKPIPGHPALMGRVTNYPSFDEALTAVKQAKSDARVFSNSAKGQEEPMQARAMVERADKLESEFHAAIQNLIGPKYKVDYAKAQDQFGKALRLQEILGDPSVYYEGPNGITLDQNAVRAAILKNIKDFNPDVFPAATRALSGGEPFGANKEIRLPGLSVQPGVGGSRQYLGGFPLFTQRPGTSIGPGALQSSLLGLTGGDISRPWRSRGDRGSLGTPVQ